MKKINVTVEMGSDGTFGAYIADNPLPYTVIGDGATAEDARQDLLSSYREMQRYYQDKGETFEEAAFVFETDVCSVLQYYKPFLSLSGLERITGVNQKQLSHYVNGNSRPSRATAAKITAALSAFARNLLAAVGG